MSRNSRNFSDPPTTYNLVDSGKPKLTSIEPARRSELGNRSLHSFMTLNDQYNGQLAGLGTIKRPPTVPENKEMFEDDLHNVLTCEGRNFLCVGHD